MASPHAHEGYEYQDLLTCYFILNEILEENTAEFIIDKKEFAGDKMDDLTILIRDRRYKKQVKYSNADVNHTLSKLDFSAESTYGLSLDALYESWRINPAYDKSEFRLCLAWREPVDEVLQVLQSVSGRQTFSTFDTKVFKIDAAKLWPAGQEPIASWRRFKSAAKTIDRDLFSEFCDALIIEVLMPKFSLNIWQPGELENIILKQAQILGVGIFPNEQWKPETFILALLAIVKRSRSKAMTLSITAIFHELNLNTDYGSIEQNFPVIASENIIRRSRIGEFITEIQAVDRTLLLGEPGSGKSWFVENLCRHLKQKKINVVRHFCYTDLDDAFQKERIKLNVFYGNLISGILTAYPNLKKHKGAKYASNLHELNTLLVNIDEPTYLIIDGLDHIERIATFRSYTDISEQDRAIISGIGGLSVSRYVKIILASQNIPELEIIPGYVRKIVPLWIERDVKKMLKNRNIPNWEISPRLSLATHLTEKSNGNPLFLKYLLDEIKRQAVYDVDAIQNLPDYSFNLSGYYAYLLTRQNLREDVAQVLSGVNFSLTRPELEEITFSGEQVVESLRILSPVLKLNVSQSGYSIYHESFRRYVLDQLRAKSVSVEYKIFRPLTAWFESKDLFAHQKAYRYYLQFLFEGGAFDKILEKLDLHFVTNSIIAGRSWELIEKNYKYFVRAASNTHDFPAIILLNEIDKIIATCQDPFHEIYTLYLESLGKLNGFQYVSDHLTYEGQPTIPDVQGLMACYLCDEHRVAAPWDLYISFFKNGKRIEKEHFIYLIRGLLVTRDHAKLNQLSGRLVKMKGSSYYKDFRSEISNYHTQHFVTELSLKYPRIGRILNEDDKPAKPGYSPEMLLLKADQLLEVEYMHDKELTIVSEFFEGVREHAGDEAIVKLLIEKFSSRNWFFNWVIYYTKLIRLGVMESPTLPEVKEAFDYLAYDLEPFKGKPQTSDLYSLHPFIFSSFEYGLSFLSNDPGWEEIIKILVKVSNKTTTFLHKSLNGPLSTDKLFRLLSGYSSPENLAYINSVFKELAENKQEYYLHNDIAEYNFRLTMQFAAMGDLDQASVYFKKAVECILGYTMRKDMTLVDAIDGVEFYARINPEKGLKDLKRVKVLVDSAVDHTDGKETHHFPVQWFERFIKIDFQKAALYLRNELLGYRFSWIAESSLIDLLCEANGKIDPVIEGYLALTFPINDSDKFLRYRISLYDRLNAMGSTIAPKLMARLVTAMRPKHNMSHSDEVIRKFNDRIAQGQYQIPFRRVIRHSEPAIPDKKWYDDIRERPDLGSMSIGSLELYFDKNAPTPNDLFSLRYLFNGFTALTPDVKELISLIVSKSNRMFSEKLDLDDVFATGGEVECYYQVYKFISERGGWHEKFVNGAAFARAQQIDADAALNYLFELLPDFLNVGFNYVFSANLIRMLVEVGYDPMVIEKCWDNLLAISAYRLPFQEPFEWDELFTDDLNEQELLICMLISRFRAGTTERSAFTIDALSELLTRDPRRMVKPFIWFFRNRQHFTRTAEIIILQMIARQSQVTQGFQEHFRDQLSAIFPTRYFIIDYLISRLYALKINIIHTPAQLTYPRIDRGLFGYFLGLNMRFAILGDNGVDLDHCFEKYASTYIREYGDSIRESYANRMAETIVPHTTSAELMLEIINTDCYEALRHWSQQGEPKDFELATFIDIDSISLRASSFGMRPSDLKKPFEYTEGASIQDDKGAGDWVRLGHVEYALQEHRTFKRKPVKSYGGVVFSTGDGPEWPHADYTLFPFLLWQGVDLGLEVDHIPVIAVLQRDLLEYFNVLWLNPSLVNHLKLTTVKRDDGLMATDQNGNVVLRMRTWISEYVGDGFRTSLSDEIPVLEGTEVMITRPYFERLCLLYPVPPRYHTVRTNGE